MKHLYVEGVVYPQTPERAAEMVARGQWYICNADHHLPEQHDEPVTIYHRNSEYKPEVRA